jgi:uncharacterized phage protein (TIGR01671 family)
MRKIKFRCWCPDTKRLFNVSSLSWDETGKITCIEGTDIKTRGACSIWDDEPRVLLQFTGLKDKNGKEIFEGDVISGEEKHYNEKEDKMKSFGIVVGHVWYNEHRPEWVVSFNHLYSETSTEFNSIWQPEVIGNIFENENLLKENFR